MLVWYEGRARAILLNSRNASSSYSYSYIVLVKYPLPVFTFACVPRLWCFCRLNFDVPNVNWTSYLGSIGRNRLIQSTPLLREIRFKHTADNYRVSKKRQNNIENSRPNMVHITISALGPGPGRSFLADDSPSLQPSYHMQTTFPNNSRRSL